MVSSQGKAMLKAVNIDVDGIGAQLQSTGAYTALYQAQEAVVKGTAELANIPQHLLDLVQS